MRTFGDLVFITGALCVTWQVVSGVLFAPRAPAAPSTGALAGANR